MGNDLKKFISQRGILFEECLQRLGDQIKTEWESPFWRELQRRPRKAFYLLDSYSPWAVRQLLGIASRLALNARSLPQFELLDWTEEVLTTRLYLAKPQSSLDSSQIILGGEKTLYLFWERYMLSQSDHFRINQVKLSRHGEWKSPLQICFGMSPSERERVYFSQGQKGTDEYDFSLAVHNDRDLLVAELEFKVEWETHRSIGD